MRKLLLTALVLIGAALLGAASVVGARGDAGPEPLFGAVLEEGALAIGRSHDGAVLSTDALAPARASR